MADRVVFMDGGLVVEQGRPDQVLNRPTQEGTQRFLARVLAPVNNDPAGRQETTSGG